MACILYSSFVKQRSYELTEIVWFDAPSGVLDEEKFHQRPLDFFNLESDVQSLIISSPGTSCDIVQLAAVSGHHTLNLFMVPRCRMEPGASRITGFRVRRHRLFRHRRPVLTNSLKEALVSFITFLRMFGRPLLVGHNIRRFDCLVLARVLDEFELKAAFQAGIVGFVDSLPLTRQLLKDTGVHSFKQENLVKTVLGVSYAAHDALGDVQALQKLYWALRPTASQIRQHTFSMDSLCNKGSQERITCVNVKVDSGGDLPLLHSSD